MVFYFFFNKKCEATNKDITRTEGYDGKIGKENQTTPDRAKKGVYLICKGNWNSEEHIL